MNPEITTHYDRELINKAAFLYWKKTFFSTFLICVLGALIALGMLLLVDFGSWVTRAFLGISVLGAVIFSASYYIFRNRSLSTFNKMNETSAHWTLSKETWAVKSDIGSSEMRWDIIKKIIKSEKFWLLVYHNSAYTVFPVSGVSTDALQFMSNKVIEHGGSVT